MIHRSYCSLEHSYQHSPLLERLNAITARVLNFVAFSLVKPEMDFIDPPAKSALNSSVSDYT